MLDISFWIEFYELMYSIWKIDWNINQMQIWYDFQLVTFILLGEKK